MRIRVEIVDTEPAAKSGTYVYDSGEIEGLGLAETLEALTAFLLRSLNAMRALEVTAP